MRSTHFLGDRATCTVNHQQKRLDVTVRPFCGTRAYVIEESVAEPLLIGQCTMPRWPAQVESRARVHRQRLSLRADNVLYPVYEDVYGLHRTLSHVLDRYEMNEVPRLTTALEYCQILHSVVLGLRKDNFQELIGRIEALVDQVVVAIGLNVKNEEKDAALERIIVTRKGVDSLNRVNSSAACLRMLTAVGNLIHREAQVSDISEVYAGRRQAVRLALAMLETQVLIVEDFLHQILANWNIVRVRRRELTAEQLEQFAKTLALIGVKPFSTTFQHVVREFSTAAQQIRAGRLDQARPLLVTAAESLRLRKLRVQLEVVHYRVSSATYDPAMRKRAGQIAQVALAELSPLVQELQAVNTLGMVDFSSAVTLSTLADVQAALGEGNCAVAADNFRLALRAI